MRRRTFLTALALGGAGLTGLGGCRMGGLLNPCLEVRLPPGLTNHPLIQGAWRGIDPARVLDVHVHLAGTGDGGRGDDGPWVSPHGKTLRRPAQFAAKRAYMNAACADPRDVDASYVARMAALMEAFPPGARALLLAFDWHHDAAGRPVREMSHFHLPNSYAAAVAANHPERFLWAASIHPHRPDAVDALEEAAAQGALAVKWLPQAMGIDPASHRCDAFYAAAARLGLPILCHAGEEKAVDGGDQELGNPLRLRRALERGVRVIVAHCASVGKGIDGDRGENGPKVDNFDLFSRLMGENEWKGLLFGDISAVTLANRPESVLKRLVARKEWHGRLMNGSDYPLPGAIFLVWLWRLQRWGYLAAEEVSVLDRLRHHNPLLFDFVLKRSLRVKGEGFPPEVFETARFF